MLGAAPQDERDRLGVIDVLDEYLLVAGQLLLGDRAGEAEVVGSDVRDVRDDAGARRTGERADVGLLRAADRQDTSWAR